MQTKILQDGTASFTLSVREGSRNSPVVLFAVGAAGNPDRHTTLYEVLAEHDCTIVAPHFDALASSWPTEAELTLRARRLSLALDAYVEPGATATAVGHSLGAASLLALAGAQLWLGPGQRVDIATDSRLVRLALLATPTGFFRAPGALNSVTVPILAWVGSVDDVTPAEQTTWLAHALPNREAVDLRITEGAGHFSVMDSPPPGKVEPLQNKQEFLRQSASEVVRFLVG